MPKFRKRPVVVEATQWLGGYDPPGVFVETPEEAMVTIGNRGRGVLHFPQKPRRYVVTIHGQRAYLDHGDWIIAESDGKHFYPCKPDEFARIYEPIGDADA